MQIISLLEKLILYRIYIKYTKSLLCEVPIAQWYWIFSWNVH